MVAHTAALDNRNGLSDAIGSTVRENRETSNQETSNQENLENSHHHHSHRSLETVGDFVQAASVEIRQYNYRGQKFANQCYNSVHVQIFVAGLIVTNFIANMLEKQIDPSGKRYSDVWDALDLCFNIIFTIELLTNLYAHWWKEFWESAWNVFDVVVVTIGIVNMMRLPLPDAFGLLRMCRAFRIFRLFKRVKSLNRILVALIHAVPGVVNAFVILTIVMSIYAILGVQFFRTIGDSCKHPDWTRKGYATARLAPDTLCLGPEYFGSFLRSWFTHFQILTQESWSEAIARPVIWSFEDMTLATGASSFFCSFILVSSFVLMNVVVAVLLDKMQASNEPVIEPLSDTELDMLRRYEKMGKVLTKLSESIQNTEDELTQVRSDMASLKESIAKVSKGQQQSSTNSSGIGVKESI